MDAPPPPVPTHKIPVSTSKPIVKNIIPTELQLAFLQDNLPFGYLITEIISTSLLGQQGNLSRTYKLELKFSDDAPKDLPTLFCVKLHSTRVVKNKTTLYEREVNVLTKFVSGFEISPKLYFTRLVKDNMMIVMELLQNGRFRRNDEPIESNQEALSILTELRDFQKHTLISQDKQQEFLSKYPFIYSGFDFMIVSFFPHLVKEGKEAKTKALINMFLSNLDTIMESTQAPRVKEAFEELGKHIHNDWKGKMEVALEYITKEAPLSLVHGDFKLDNIFLCDNGKVRIIDWQSASLGNPLFDATNFVTQSVTKELSTTSYENIIIPIYSSLFEPNVLRQLFETALWMQLMGVSLFANSPVLKSATINLHLKQEIGTVYDLILRGAEYTPLLLCKILKGE